MVRSKQWLWLGTSCACALYFFYLYRFAVDLPFWDDYDAILGALSTLRDSHDWQQYLFHPHNEHVIFWVRLLAWVQLAVTGEVDFRQLILLGNLFVPGILLIWYQVVKQSLLTQAPANGLEVNWTFICAVCMLLLLSITYWESSLWAMAALSNFPVLFFSLAALLLFHRNDSAAALAGTAVLAVFAALSQANGLFVFVVIGLRLLLSRNWMRTTLWAVLSLAVLACYLSLRQGSATAAASKASALQMFLFLVRFFGSFIADLHVALALGLLLTALIAAALICRRKEHTPLLGSILLFLLITAVATCYTRASNWAEGALASRYAINSALIIMSAICLYAQWFSAARLRLLLALGLAAVVNVAAYESLHYRVIARFAQLEQTTLPDLSCARHFVYPDQEWADQIYQRAVLQGIYHIRLKPGTKCEDLKLELAQGVKPSPLAKALGGHIDSWQEDGGRITATGWLRIGVADTHPQLLAALPDLPIKSRLVRVLREDVAVRYGNNLRVSGFSLTMDFATSQQAQDAAKSACLAFSSDQTQGIVLLRGGDAHCDGFLIKAAPAAQP